MLHDQSLTQAEQAFLNAPFAPGGWQVAVDALAAATRSRHAQLVGIGGPLTIPFHILSDWPDDPNGHMNNVSLVGHGNWRIGTSDKAMTIRHEAHYAAYKADHFSADYEDAMSDLDFQFGCHTALTLETSGSTRLALLRTRREGACDSDTLERFALLARQAERAFRVQLALGEQAAELMLAGVEGRGEATMLLDRTGQICGMSAAAEALLDEQQGLHEEGFAVRLSDNNENQAFGAAMGRLLHGDGVNGPVLHEMVVGRSSDNPGGRWRLIIARLPEIEPGLNFAPTLAVTLRSKGHQNQMVMPVVAAA